MTNSPATTSFYSILSTMSSYEDEEEEEDFEEEPHIIQTLDAVDWDFLLHRASRLRHLGQPGELPPPRLGDYLVGGYNVVRFIHFDDGVEWVARLPQFPDHPAPPATSSTDTQESWKDHRTDWDEETFSALARKLHNEVATMHYIQHHTSIPVPVVFDYNFDRDGGGVGIPYMLMSRVQGKPLCEAWEDMVDEDRREVMREVANMLLELSEHRFEKIGSLRLDEPLMDDVTPMPNPVPLPTPPTTPSQSPLSSRARRSASPPLSRSPDNFRYRIDPPVDQPCTAHLTIPLGRTFTDPVDYWKTYVTAELSSLLDVRFGDPRKLDQYAALRFALDLVPSLYESDGEEKGFPIYPHDLYAQNIMISYDPPSSYSTSSLASVSTLDIDTPASSESSYSSTASSSTSTSASSVQRKPHITGLIDWEFACTASFTTFAQFPCFLLDDPRWASSSPDNDEPHPLLLRNQRDRQMFLELLEDAEQALDKDIPLTRAVARSKGVTLFERVVQFDRWRDKLIRELLEYFIIGHYPGIDSLESAKAMLISRLPQELVERFEKERVMMEELRGLAPWIGPRLISKQAVRKIIEANSIEQMKEFQLYLDQVDRLDAVLEG